MPRVFSCPAPAHCLVGLADVGTKWNDCVRLVYARASSVPRVHSVRFCSWGKLPLCIVARTAYAMRPPPFGLPQTPLQEYMVAFEAVLRALSAAGNSRLSVPGRQTKAGREREKNRNGIPYLLPLQRQPSAHIRHRRCMRFYLFIAYANSWPMRGVGRRIVLRFSLVDRELVWHERGSQREEGVYSRRR